MKALSLGLVKGSIDQVDKKVHMTWVQPRVLDRNQVTYTNTPNLHSLYYLNFCIGVKSLLGFFFFLARGILRGMENFLAGGGV